MLSTLIAGLLTLALGFLVAWLAAWVLSVRTPGAVLSARTWRWGAIGAAGAALLLFLVQLLPGVGLLAAEQVAMATALPTATGRTSETATAYLTYTPASTYTPYPTYTPLPTATATSTATRTPTLTATPMMTLTLPVVGASTIVPTATATVTPTLAPTEIPLPTATSTLTQTPTYTPTVDLSHTPTVQAAPADTDVDGLPPTGGSADPAVIAVISALLAILGGCAFWETTRGLREDT